MPTPARYRDAPPASTDHLHWHHTPLLTWCFDALSVALPAGEAFISQAVQAAITQGLPPACAQAAADLVRDETSHSSTHRRYNQRLDALGYPASIHAQRLEVELQCLGSRLDLDAKLALAAGFEAIAVRLARLCLKGGRWLPLKENASTRLWRWHAREEVAHGDAIRQVLAHRNPGPLLQAAMSLLAASLLAVDVVSMAARMAWIDLRQRRVGPASLALGAIDLGGRLFIEGLERLRWRSASAGQGHCAVRRLRAEDLGAVMALEHRKWKSGQAADAATVLKRISTHPELCLGVFSSVSGNALATLFMKPMARHLPEGAGSWAQLARIDEPSSHGDGGTLFGISLSSDDPSAVQALLHHFWPVALHSGYRRILLGSPMPGYKAYVADHPLVSAQDYASLKRRGVPLDHQLRYYHRHGFDRLVGVRANYFPDDRSLDNAALLEARIPLSALSPLWRRMPLVIVRMICAAALRVGVGPR